MRILHCNTHDAVGGAAIAARRIHYALLEAGLESRMYVRDAQTGVPTVLPCKTNIPRRLWNKVANKLEYLVRQHFYAPPQTAGYCTFNILPWGIVSTLPDVGQALTHLHWLTDRFLLSGALARIQTPIVWTLHDRNPLTGGCHVRQGCERYKGKCGQCPQLGSAKERDLSRWNWHCKRDALRGKRVHVVCPSACLADEARQSSLLGSFPVSVIPNCVPSDIYRPMDKALCRSLLNIPNDGKPLLLFGAMSPTSDYNKGYDLLTATLVQIPRDSYRCLIFGACAPLREQSAGGGDTIWLGRLHDDISIAIAYNAADVFVCPSREEAFSLTTLESLSCGTPVVGFNIGGLPDMINHGEHGFLAKPYDTNELALHIQVLLADCHLRQRMGHAAREKVKCCYTPEVVVQLYMNVYEEILAGK